MAMDIIGDVYLPVPVGDEKLVQVVKSPSFSFYMHHGRASRGISRAILADTGIPVLEPKSFSFKFYSIPIYIP